MVIVVGIPCMGTIHSETVGSLIRMILSYKDIEFRPYIISHSLVYDARNAILNYALEQNADYLLFVDSDIMFPQEALATLLNMNKPMVTGVYWTRSEEHKEQVVYEKVTPRRFKKSPSADPVRHKIEVPEEVAACGMGFCLIRKDLLRNVCKHFRSPYEPYKGLGEDIAFCYRVGKLNVPIWAINVGLEHIGQKRYKGD